MLFNPLSGFKVLTNPFTPCSIIVKGKLCLEKVSSEGDGITSSTVLSSHAIHFQFEINLIKIFIFK